jgi:RNA polymerase sigma-70 factor (ECF subfamily)
MVFNPVMPLPAAPAVSAIAASTAVILPEPAELYRLYQPLVASLCHRLCGRREQAEDLCQETWAAILAGLGGFRGDAKLSTWIYTVTRRVALRQLEREKRRGLADFAWTRARTPAAAGPPPGRDPDEWVGRNCRSCVEGMVHCLAPDKRLVYVLREFIKLPHAEIARITGRSPGAVRQIHARACRRIGRFIQRNCPLFNPSDTCSCNMKGLLPATRLAAEIADTAATVEDFLEKLADPHYHTA